MFNANGDEQVKKKKPTTTKKSQSKLMRNNMIGIVALVLVIYGLNKYSSQAS